MKKIPSIVLYVVAGLMLIYCVWSLVHCTGIISEAISAGQVTMRDNLYDITSFYFANCAAYFVYALVLSSIGLILQRGQKVATIVSNSPVQPAASDTNDAELDEWFEEDNTAGNDEADKEA